MEKVDQIESERKVSIGFEEVYTAGKALEGTQPKSPWEYAMGNKDTGGEKM